MKQDYEGADKDESEERFWTRQARFAALWNEDCSARGASYV
jgi:hypothetical protein